MLPSPEGLGVQCPLTHSMSAEHSSPRVARSALSLFPESEVPVGVVFAQERVKAQDIRRMESVLDVLRMGGFKHKSGVGFSLVCVFYRCCGVAASCLADQ